MTPAALPHGDLPALLRRALALWSEPVPPGEQALEAFRSVYDDPVAVNGTMTPLGVLVERARMMQAAFGGLRHRVDEIAEAPGRLAFAFHLSGRHVGPLLTPAGELAPTGQEMDVAGMDIFVVDEQQDRVTAVWAVADLLPLLVAAAAVPRPPEAS